MPALSVLQREEANRNPVVAYIHCMLQLGEVKTADNKMTLMHYLAQMCAKSYPHLVTFVVCIDVTLRPVSDSAIPRHSFRYPKR